jgi:restriction endonuclease Mrr
MAIKKRKSGFERLMASPWWISGGLAAAVFFTPQVNLLSVATSKSVFISSFAKGVHSTIELLVPFISGGLLLLSLFIWINSRTNNKPAEAVSHWIAQLTAKDNNTVSDAAEVLDAGLINRESKTATAKPAVWSIDFLQAIEMKHFKELCEALFNELNLVAQNTTFNADGSVEMELYAKQSPDSLAAIVQCRTGPDFVGETHVRAFHDVMVASGINKAYFVISSSFTENAIRASKSSGMTLISGDVLLGLIASRSPEKSAELLKLVTTGD